MYVFSLHGMILPIAPGKMQVKIKNQNETVTLINEGEFNIIKRPGLTDISFTATSPAHNYPWAIHQNNIFRPPTYYLDLLEKLKTNEKSFPFFVTKWLDNGRIWDESFEMTVTLEDYTFTEAADNGHDVEVDIKLKQYVPYSALIVNIQNGTASTEGERETGTLDDIADENEGESYTVVSGDTLWNIAKRYLGDGTRNTELYAANKDVIEAAAVANGQTDSMNGQWIYPGTRLTIQS